MARPATRPPLALRRVSARLTSHTPRRKRKQPLCLSEPWHQESADEEPVKAIRRYWCGSADVLELRDIDTPVVRRRRTGPRVVGLRQPAAAAGRGRIGLSVCVWCPTTVS